MAERFRKEIAAARFAFLGPQGRGRLTISGGLASFPEDGKTAEELLNRADQALFEAKRQGKNKIMIIGDKNSNYTSASKEGASSSPSAASDKTQKTDTSTQDQPADELKETDSISSSQSPSSRPASPENKL
jgi:predicted signal transduction protein with EAL and GGDEF domain